MGRGCVIRDLLAQLTSQPTNKAKLARLSRTKRGSLFSLLVVKYGLAFTQRFWTLKTGSLEFPQKVYRIEMPSTSGASLTEIAA